ncbi:hypothetical protein RB979_003739 [Vibrio alginolyticus]|uniref:hypothetical protein n=1 Tax=Vibrio alginolyticus TaxID=663 RepID=UPI001BD3CE32|nr:hypothetical protein [Vibrio alginolyticus]ELA6781485.1 hypothetical protein [Vibrio alginolyticus]MBS9931020.1 hypothetical protein [Vibrio alginolyticus]
MLKIIIAKQHKCSEDDVQIIAPEVLPEVEKTTQVNVKYLVSGVEFETSITVTPTIRK